MEPFSPLTTYATIDYLFTLTDFTFLINLKVKETNMKNAENYFYMVEQTPWGKLFYDIVFAQLTEHTTTHLKILDFGSGLGKTANHYAKHHQVYAYEPDLDILEYAYTDHDYLQLTMDFTAFMRYLTDHKLSFDLILCHNVLDYIENQEEVILSLSKCLTSKGKLSVIKHQELGHLVNDAVFNDDPQLVLKKLDGLPTQTSFGKINYCTQEELSQWLSTDSIDLIDVMGIRNFYALSQNNQIKYTENWYKNMLELELRVCKDATFIPLAFFNHLIFQKKIR